MKQIEATTSKQKKPGASAKKKIEKVLYLLPSVMIFGVFMVWPIIYNFYLSFNEWNMVAPSKRFVGLRNYASILTDPDFLKALGNTALYVALMMAFCFVLPYFISYILGKLINTGQNIYRSLLFFPSLLSLAVAAIVFLWLFNSVSGPVAEIFKLFGRQSPKWFSSSGYVIFILSIVTAWRSFGYNLIV